MEIAENTQAAPIQEEPTMIQLMQKQLRLTRIMMLSSLGLVVILVAVVLTLVPSIMRTVDDTESLIVNLNKTVSQLEGLEQVMEDVTKVTEELSAADITGMLEDISLLVGSSQDTLSATRAKIDSMDMDSLNDAVADLAAIVEPLARLFGRS